MGEERERERERERESPEDKIYHQRLWMVLFSLLHITWKMKCDEGLIRLSVDMGTTDIKGKNMQISMLLWVIHIYVKEGG